MPIYEYRCDNCQHHFDVFQKMSDANVTTCPQCEKKDTVVRLISAAGFQLKGSGWYATDFKTQTKTSSSEQATSDSKPTETKTETPSTDKTGSSSE